MGEVVPEAPPSTAPPSPSTALSELTTPRSPEQQPQSETETETEVPVSPLLLMESPSAIAAIAEGVAEDPFGNEEFLDADTFDLLANLNTFDDATSTTTDDSGPPTYFTPVPESEEARPHKATKPPRSEGAIAETEAMWKAIAKPLNPDRRARRGTAVYVEARADKECHIKNHPCYKAECPYCGPTMPGNNKRK